MIIYEKDNKLNINFENNVEETPDISIGKDGDKTEILVDGQQSSGGGGGGEKFVLTATMIGLNTATIDKTPSEAIKAYNQGKTIVLKVPYITQESEYFPCYVDFEENDNDDVDGGSFSAQYIFVTTYTLYCIEVNNTDPGELSATLTTIILNQNN